MVEFFEHQSHDVHPYKCWLFHTLRDNWFGFLTLSYDFLARESSGQTARIWLWWGIVFILFFFTMCFLQCKYVKDIFSFKWETMGSGKIRANWWFKRTQPAFQPSFTEVSARIGKEAMEAGREARQWACSVVVLIIVWEAGKFVSLEIPNRGASQSTLLTHWYS